MCDDLGQVPDVYILPKIGIIFFLDRRLAGGRMWFLPRHAFLLSVCFVCFSASVPYSAAKTPHPVLSPVTANQTKQVTCQVLLCSRDMQWLPLSLKTVLFEVLMLMKWPVSPTKAWDTFPTVYTRLCVVGRSGPDTVFGGRLTFCI